MSQGISNLNGSDEQSISDGFHTMDELYEFRKMYNALLFNEWAERGDCLIHDKYNIHHRVKHSVHKSWKHYDGEIPFNDPDWFIVSAMLSTGLITNHYHKDDWNLFKVPHVEKALFEYDGHTSADVLQRMKKHIES